MTTSRPQWAETIRHFVTDGIIDEKYGWPMEGDDPPEYDEIERRVLDALCDAFGHEIIYDQCGIPEHRYCVFCNRRETDLESQPE